MSKSGQCTPVNLLIKEYSIMVSKKLADNLGISGLCCVPPNVMIGKKYEFYVGMPNKLVCLGRLDTDSEFVMKYVKGLKDDRADVIYSENSDGLIGKLALGNIVTHLEEHCRFVGNIQDAKAIITRLLERVEEYQAEWLKISDRFNGYCDKILELLERKSECLSIKSGATINAKSQNLILKVPEGCSKERMISAARNVRDLFNRAGYAGKVGLHIDKPNGVVTFYFVPKLSGWCI